MVQTVTYDFDVCIIGSGAGAGPVALTLARAGKKVLILEKGPWLTEQDFYKDELACCRRDAYTPKKTNEPHVVEDYDGKGGWQRESTENSNWNFWNGNVVGGSSNFMSGFFYRMKPNDFRLHSVYGPIADANVVDWPISYEDMEPWYSLVEREVGISGKVAAHPFQEPRSTPDFPFPPTVEHPINSLFDTTCRDLKLNPLQTPRAILSRPDKGRRSCEYSGYCGSYGCSSGAKGSSRTALLNQAVATGNCEIRPQSKVYKLESDSNGKVVAAHYYDKADQPLKVDARIFVVACQAIETSRLLLTSTGPKHPKGLANNYGQVGKNLLFSAGGSGRGEFFYDQLERMTAEEMSVLGPFVNRNLQDWYEINDPQFGYRAKGGLIDFLFRHPNPTGRAMSTKWSGGELVWGKSLKRRLEKEFLGRRDFDFEIFCDWLPTDNCFVELDPEVKDKWGDPVAKIRIGYHRHDLKVGNYLSEKAESVLIEMGAKNVRSSISGNPPPNLVAGGCRFGTDPTQSVLDKNCRAHDVENLYVTDGSFIPTGGSVPYTWTIYANAFRVSDYIVNQLG